MVPYEAFLAEKPVVTTTDAGGPLEVVTDGATGLVAEPRAESRGRRVRQAQPRRRGAPGGAPAGRSPSASPGTRRSTGCWADEGRLLLAAAAVAVGDRRLLGSAPAGARGAHGRRRRPQPGRFRRAGTPERRTSACTTSATTRSSTGGSSRRCGGGPASSSCTSSCSTTSSRGSPSPAATSRATAPRSSARRARRAALLGHAVQAGRIEPLWETRAQEFPLAPGGARRRHRADRPLALRRGPGPRRRLRGADLAGADAGMARAADRAARASRAARCRLLRPRQREQADPAARLGVRAAARTPTGCAPAPGRLLVAAASSRSRSADGVIRRDYVAEDELWSLLAACDVVVSLRWPTMGETSAAAVRALSLGKPLVVSDVGAFRELPDEVAIKVPVGEGEIEALVEAIERAAAERGDERAPPSACRNRALTSTGRLISTPRHCERQ